MAAVAPPRCVLEVNFDRLRQEIEWWLERQERLTFVERGPALDRVALEAGVSRRLLSRLLAGGQIDPANAERILDAIDYRDGPRRHQRTNQLLPLVIRSRHLVDGRRRQPGETGRIKRVDWANAKLSEAQLRAIYRVHIDGGVSLREICRRGWKQWGYASERSALNVISKRLRSIGLQPRPRAEATALANRTRPGVEKPAHMSRNEWRRRKRAVLRATDPAFRAEELERIAGLRERERRQREEAAAA